MRKYRKTPEGRYICYKANWRVQGLIGDYRKIFDRFEATTHCDLCQKELSSRYDDTRKCMDHDHRTGEFRSITCQPCNSSKRDRAKNKNNTSGHKGVSIQLRKPPRQDAWVYRREINGKKYHYSRISKIDILVIKFAVIMLDFKSV
jgi:hypothetical protein